MCYKNHECIKTKLWMSRVQYFWKSEKKPKPIYNYFWSVKITWTVKYVCIHLDELMSVCKNCKRLINVYEHICNVHNECTLNMNAHFISVTPVFASQGVHNKIEQKHVCCVSRFGPMAWLWVWFFMLPWPVFLVSLPSSSLSTISLGIPGQVWSIFNQIHYL